MSYYSNIEEKIELFIREPFISFLPYESHVTSIIPIDNIPISILIDYFDIVSYKIKFSSEEYFYDFFLGENINSEKISHDFIPRYCINTYDEFVEIIYANLKQGGYIYLTVDTSVINSYKKLPFKMIHSPLIVGIDIEQKKIKISDFFDFTKYSSKWDSLEDFYEGYRNLQIYIIKELVELEKSSSRWLTHFEILKYNHGVFESNSFIYKKIINILSDYLFSKKSNLYTEDLFFKYNSYLNKEKNLKAYKILKINGIKNYDKLLFNFKNELNFSDLKKNIVLLNKHYYVLSKIINYTVKKERKKDFNIDELFNISKHLIIKLSFKNKDLTHIDEKIKSLKNKEEYIIKKLIKYIKEAYFYEI